MPQLLELFPGTKSVSKVAKTLGWATLSLDIDPTYSPEICLGMLDVDETKHLKNYVDFAWASCPCESYSQACTRANIPRAEAMDDSDGLVAKTRQIIRYFGCAYCIENLTFSPLWKRNVAQGLLAVSVITSY